MKGFENIHLDNMYMRWTNKPWSDTNTTQWEAGLSAVNFVTTVLTTLNITDHCLEFYWLLLYRNIITSLQTF